MNVRRTTFSLVLLSFSLSFSEPMKEADSILGKKPTYDEPETSVVESITTYFNPSEAKQKSPPLPFTTLATATSFVRSQRGLGGRGLPATFYLPENVTIEDPLRRLIVAEGVGLYDTALAVIALIEAGDLKTAREILDIYRDGTYAVSSITPMELRAIPSSYNGEAFSNFDTDTYYFFDFTNVHGEWLRWKDGWKFWTTHTGPNAWFINALVRFIDASRRQGQSEAFVRPYMKLARSLGDAMLRLQDNQALGGVRFGPQNQYHDPDSAPPFEQINSENNLSAYVAFRMLHHVTGDVVYEQAAKRIQDWFVKAEVWTPEGQAQQGLFDKSSGTLAMGAQWKDGRWVLQPEHATDSAGTWAISSLGPHTIDTLWGRGAAYAMWRTIRSRAGRTADFRIAQATDTLAGLDYIDAFSEKESLISPEWTAGGLYALRALIGYYKITSTTTVTSVELRGMEKDRDSMIEFLRKNPNAYALGPGHEGERQARTGFGWYCPPPEVHAMPSIYVALFLEGKPDPSGWWRVVSGVR